MLGGTSGMEELRTSEKAYFVFEWLLYARATKYKGLKNEN